MINTKQWKPISLVILFLTVPLLLYVNTRGESTDEARSSNNNNLPSFAFKSPETERAQPQHKDNGHVAIIERHFKEKNKKREGGNQKYDIVEQVDFALARIASQSDAKFIKEEKHHVDDRRGKDNHITQRIQPNEDKSTLVNIPDDVINMAPNVFKKVPRQFLPEYKSPCWWKKRGDLYCLPYFYIIGMAKCGTTELWDKIIQHPDVIGSVPKEPHWWARRRHGYTGVPIHGTQVHRIRAMTGKRDDSSIDWYLNWCKTFGVKSIESNPSQNADGNVIYPKVFGDASVSTSFDIWGSWGSKEGNYTNADLIHAVQPQAKIIMIVRDPTERFFSSFNYNSGRDKSLTAFDKLAKSATGCFTRCLQNHSERFCLFTKQCEMVKGMYIVYAEDWMKLYGKDGVHILRLEDWHANTAEELQKVLQFLELPALSEDEMVKIINRKAKNVNSKKANRPSMWNTTRQVLHDFFRPYNRRLARLLNDSRFSYDKR